MPNAIAELDHLMMAVNDHRVATCNLERLGFKVRPVRQLAPMGGGAAGGDGGSAAVLLHARTPGCANYLEIARADPRTAQPFMRDLLCAGEGAAMMVHATHDAAKLAEEWRKIDLELVTFHVTLPPMGAGEDVEVDIVLPLPGQLPLAVNACRYSDVADFERDEWRDHPNGALAWAGLTFRVVPGDFASVVDRYAQVYGSRPKPAGDASRFGPNFVFFDISPRSASPPSSPAATVHVEVASLNRLVDHLRGAGVPFRETDGTILVEAAYANGSAMAFAEPLRVG